MLRARHGMAGLGGLKVTNVRSLRRARPEITADIRGYHSGFSLWCDRLIPSAGMPLLTIHMSPLGAHTADPFPSGRRHAKEQRTMGKGFTGTLHECEAGS